MSAATVFAMRRHGNTRDTAGMALAKLLAAASGRCPAEHGKAHTLILPCGPPAQGNRRLLVDCSPGRKERADWAAGAIAVS